MSFDASLHPYILISSLVKKLSVQFARLEIVFTFYRKTLPLYIVQFSKNLCPFGLVEISRIELLTPCLQGRCSPS